ncbi:transcription initiation factor TFB [Halosimplex carlsbadense 2-9-1]|uniref:Transcription initiation factor TFB n=1 Tax=Halosimplex carlsbadense 2-9-1 TaxID=797114 RepID=M0CC87_9EURY|nr:transcription initiation factor IIB family protein [Halosimplex carlsbadense]ELZ20855.1 transcription initiation factor TFB [Halosimplex carlsbadense 2-9-1]
MATREPYQQTFDEQTDGSISADDCPECDGRLRTDGGETCCTDCGLVVEACRVDRRGPRTFDEDDTDRRRTGAPLTEARHDRGLSTKIGYATDGNGNQLSGRKQRQLARLRREHTRAKWQSKAERNLAHGCTEIARIVGALGLDHDDREQASSLFRSAQQADLLRGRSIEAFAAATVYAVCRCTEATRTLGEVASVAQCARRKVTNAYDVLNDDLGLPAPPQRPRSFIPALASAMGVPAETESHARALTERAWAASESLGTHPAGFAAGALAVACRDHGVDIVQLDLAGAADVSPVTVRTHRDTIEADRDGWER